MNRRFTFPEEETLMANKYTKICSTSLGIREMQIEIKISFYTHKIGKTKCGWRCGAMGTHLLLAGASTGAQALRKRSRVTPRAEHMRSPGASNFTWRNPCPVHQETHAKCPQPSPAMWPGIRYFIFPCLCFLVCMRILIILTRRVVVRIHIEAP